MKEEKFLTKKIIRSYLNSLYVNELCQGLKDVSWVHPDDRHFITSETWKIIEDAKNTNNK